MKTFKDLDFKAIAGLPLKLFHGVRARMEFPNGYGISVIQSTFSYGGDEGLFEIGVLDSDGELTYKTPITCDVIGHLTTDEVSEIMIQIQKLPNLLIALLCLN